MLIPIAALFACLAAVSATSAQTHARVPASEGGEVPLELTRITSPIAIDGVMTDEAWRTIVPLPLTMYSPVFRGRPTQRSEIRVAYDEQYFYAGGWFYDSDAKAIRINSLYRDRWNGDDTLAIYIDPFNDDQNAKWFGITPAGMRFDQLVSDDGNTLNENWDGFWEAKTAISDEGWFVEVRIPFSTIGFQVDDEGRAPDEGRAARLPLQPSRQDEPGLLLHGLGNRRAQPGEAHPGGSATPTMVRPRTCRSA